MSPQHLSRGREKRGLLCEQGEAGASDDAGGATGTGGPFMSSLAIRPGTAAVLETGPGGQREEHSGGAHDVLQRKK